MKLQRYLLFFLLAAGCLTAGLSEAQKPAEKQTGNAKKPLVKTTLGTATGNISMPAAEAGTLIALPLKITGEKNLDYAISSYRLAYKRLGVKEDEETGQVTEESDVVAERFTVTPLPQVWQKNITDGLHKGEQLYFFDVIAFDKQGRRFFAPELKISIQ